MRTIAPRRITGVDRRLATAAISASSVFVGLLVLLHLVRPDLDPTWRFISEYALGPAGILLPVAFLAEVATCGALAGLIWRRTRTVTGRIGAVLAAVSAAGFLIAAIFRTDPVSTPSADATFAGTMHAVGGALNLTPLALLLLVIGLRRAPEVAGFRTLLWLVTGVTLAASICFTADSATAGAQVGPGDYAGLFGRLMMLGFSAGVVVTGIGVLRFARRQHPAPTSNPAEPVQPRVGVR